MKRTFIPPEYRPHVRGSRLTEKSNDSPQNSIFEEIQDDRKRRALMVDLIQKKRSIGKLKPQEAASLLLEIFPQLSSLQSKES